MLMFFRLRERERPRSRKRKRLIDSLIPVGDTDKGTLKNKNKNLNAEVKERSSWQLAGPSDRARPSGSGTRPDDSETTLDLSHRIRQSGGVGTVHSDPSRKTVSHSFPTPPITEIIPEEVLTGPLPVPVELGVRLLSGGRPISCC